MDWDIALVFISGITIIIPVLFGVAVLVKK